MKQIRETDGIPYAAQCQSLGVGYASFMRWCQRMDRGEEAITRPGPKKVEDFDLEALREEIRTLTHRRKRTAGAGDLFERHRNDISRRDLQRLVREERLRKNRERNRVLSQVSWRAPRMIWSMDDTEYQPFKGYPKAILHNVQDLSSRYKFDPLVGMHLPEGPEVARNLEGLFEAHGPPLFLKRDNGGNLNHHIINELLEAFLVVPLNSPTFYPPYNGGIEVAQGEIKRQLSKHPKHLASLLSIQAQIDTQNLNHQRRPCLQNRTACQLFASGQGLARTYTKRKRREVYDQIREMTAKVVEETDYDEDDAWRHAVETWLQDNGFIIVLKQQKV
jgi:hypothetical protein